MDHALLCKLLHNNKTYLYYSLIHKNVTGSNVMKKYISYILILCCISSLSQAEISFLELKGLYNGIKEDKKYLSPVHGFNWFKTGVVENMYRYGDEADATIKLIKELFYLQPDGVTFDITSLARKPAKYFTPRTIGKILNVIEKYKDKTLDPSSKVEISTLLKNIIKEDINFDDLQQLINRTIEKIQQEVGPIADKKQLNLEKRAAEQKITKIKKGKVKTIKTKEEKAQAITPLQARIEEIQGEVQKITVRERLLKRKIHDISLNEKLIDELVGYMLGCLAETQEQKYIPYALQQLLLAFAWKVADSKEQLIDYFEQFETPIITKNKIELLQELYSKKDYEHFKENLEKNVSFILKDYELSSFGSYGRTVWDKPYPPVISGISDTRYVDIAGIEHFFSDCVETSLRNFFNIVLYNKSTSTFDITSLIKQPEEKGLKLLPAFIDYYTKHNKTSHLQTKPYYNDWAQLVADIPGITYVKGAYEIKTSLSNILKVVNYLLFGNSAAFASKSNQEKLNILVQALSHENFAIRWEVKDGPDNLVDTQDTLIILLFSVNNDTYSFEWGFEPRHSVISNIQSNLIKPAKFILPELAKHIFLGSINEINLLGWYETVTYDNQLADMQKNDLSASYYDFFCFTQNLNNNNCIVNLIEALLEQNIKISLGLLENLLNHLPDDFAFWKNILPALVESEVYQPLAKRLLPRYADTFLAVSLSKKRDSLYLFINQNIGMLNPLQLQHFMIKILTFKVEKLYPSVEQNTDKVNSEMLYIIIRNQLKQFYKLVNQNNINKINSANLAEIIHYIFENKITQLYPLVKQNINKVDNKEDIGQFISDIAWHTIELFYPFVIENFNKNIQHIRPRQITETINTIITKKIESLYPVITQDILDRFSISYKNNIFNKILINEIKQLYYLLPENFKPSGS